MNFMKQTNILKVVHGTLFLREYSIDILSNYHKDYNKILKKKKMYNSLSNHTFFYYNHTPYISAHKLSIKPTIQNNLTISFSLQPSLSK